MNHCFYFDKSIFSVQVSMLLLKHTMATSFATADWHSVQRSFSPLELLLLLTHSTFFSSVFSFSFPLPSGKSWCSRLPTGWVMCLWCGRALFERSLPAGGKRTAKRGLSDLSWVKEGVWEAASDIQDVLCCLPCEAESRRVGGGQGESTTAHSRQKRKPRAGVKRSPCHDLDIFFWRRCRWC